MVYLHVKLHTGLDSTFPVNWIHTHAEKKIVDGNLQVIHKKKTWSRISWHVSESNSSECSECSNSGLVAISSAILVTWRRNNKKVWPASQLPSSINPRSNIGFDCFLLLLQQTLLENQEKLLECWCLLLVFFPKPTMAHSLKNLSLIVSSSVPSASARYDERSRSGKELQVFRLVRVEDQPLMHM